MAGSVRISIGADTNELRRGLDQAAGMLKGLQQQTTKAAGAARHFASAIEAIGGASKGAAGLAGNMLGAFAVGGPMGLAIGGVNALISHFRDLNSAAAEAEKSSKAWGDRLNEQIRRNSNDLRALSAELAGDKVGAAQAKARGDVEEAQAQLEQAYAERSKAEAELADRKDDFIRLLSAEEALQARISGQLTKNVQLAQIALNQAEEKAGIKVETTQRDVTKEEKDKAAAAAKVRAEERLRQAKEADAAVRARVEGELALERQAAEERGEILAWEIEQETKARNKAREDKTKQEERDAETAKKLAAQQIEDYAQIGRALGDALASAESPAEALQAVLQQVLSSVIDTAISTITANAANAASGAAASQASIPVVGPALAVAAQVAMLASVKGLISSLPGRAAGGSVSSGRPYMVGERGPEVVVPGSSGTVIPNHGLGGTTINVTATDARSFERLLSDPTSGLSRAIRKRNRGPRV